MQTSFTEPPNSPRPRPEPVKSLRSPLAFTRHLYLSLPHPFSHTIFSVYSVSLPMVRPWGTPFPPYFPNFTVSPYQSLNITLHSTSPFLPPALYPLFNQSLPPAPLPFTQPVPEHYPLLNQSLNITLHSTSPFLPPAALPFTQPVPEHYPLLNQSLPLSRPFTSLPPVPSSRPFTLYSTSP